MPLLCLENGAILSLPDDCFAVGDYYNPVTNSIELPTKQKPPNSQFVQKLLKDIENSKKPSDDSSVVPPVKNKNVDTGNVFYDLDGNIIPRQDYDIIVTFQRPTTYIAIPYHIFRAAMREKSSDTTVSISRLILQIVSSTIDRIESSLPWLYKGVVVNLQEIKSAKKRNVRSAKSESALCENITDLIPSELNGTTKFNFDIHQKRLREAKNN